MGSKFDGFTLASWCAQAHSGCAGLTSTPLPRVCKVQTLVGRCSLALLSLSLSLSPSLPRPDSLSPPPSPALTLSLPLPTPPSLSLTQAHHAIASALASALALAGPSFAARPVFWRVCLPPFPSPASLHLSCPTALVYSSRGPASSPRPSSLRLPTFSITAIQVSGIVDQTVKFGKVTRPLLGISFAPEQSVEQLGVSGVLVLDAPPNGPAGKAGVRPTRREFCGRLVLGDVITSVTEKKISNGSDLYKILDRCEVGDAVKLEVLRGDRKVGVDVTLAPRD